ncbi:efflux RND transporter permease subunit [Arthrobacter sp. VKM Ac-2550]|uniref:efflux RND transporter permease subunit n=1 Tax=Crystallibacter permensis TaxID=1938888 RepID=UPI0022263C7D|nr:efflux RND transporter permease subunit [Arthrobacter sp. VKM Ac-2550]MCW2135136.1 hydrophobic/amphiphilic exporter-1, HAE1 family [Arthrobacter sp. VKM Ac-2550]
MHKLATLSLANRALIALITVFVAVFGVITMGSLKQELIPSLEFPRVTVVTAMPGASPEVVDKQVSEPLENALNAVEGLESSTATSRTGLSTVNLTFVYGTNLDRARSQVDRAISNAQQLLPEDVSPQSVAGSINDFPIVFMAVSSDLPLSELNTELQRLTVPKLQKLEGVRSAEVTGGSGQHIAILPDDDALADRNVSVSSIVDSLQNSGGLVPAGTVEQEQKTLSVQIGSPLDSLETIENLPLAPNQTTTTEPAPPSSASEIPGRVPGQFPGESQPAPPAPVNSAPVDTGAEGSGVRGPVTEAATGGPVTIGEVATVRIVDDERTSITRTNGEETLALAVTKTPDGDTVAISHAINDLLPELEAQLGNGAAFTTIFDQAPFIEESIKDLTTEGLLGLGFAVLVILVFLLSARSTLITAISIPLSLLVTFIGLSALGYSLNILTLGALTIAIGRVVDDSIVVVENIKRHLGYGEDKRTAIVTAVREVAGAVTASTLTTVAVFLPIAFVADLAGELFRPFAITTALALLASLAVSLTIVPVLAYWFVKSPSQRQDPAEVRAAADAKERASRLQRGYLPVLSSTQRHPVLTLGAAALVLLGTVAMVPLMQTNLLGDTGQNSFSLRQELPAGTSLEVTDEAASQVEELLAGTEGIDDVQVTMGNSTSGLGTFLSAGASVARFTVITEEGADQVALRERVRNDVEKLPDAGTITLSTQGGGFGTSSSVDIDISASNAGELQSASDTLVEELQDLPGAAEVSSNLAAAEPVVQVSIDRAKAVAAGLNEEEIAGLLASTISPLPGGTVRIDTTDYPVLIGEGTDFASVEELRDVEVPTASGPVPLTEVATVEETEIPTSITSSGGERTAVVSVTPGGDNLGALSSEVQTVLDSVELPAGVTASLGGAATQQAESFEQLGLALLAAVAIVYVIMVATFKSLVQPLILLVSIPFAATGAIALLVVTGIPLGLPSLIGMLMLVGIVVTNAIVLIDLINQYRRPHSGRPGMNVADAIRHGARQRLRPILMTALATVFALTPMALGLTGEGGFISQPLAVVVVGGLISSTALTLVLVPVLYRLVEGRRERRALARAEQLQIREPAAVGS